MSEESPGTYAIWMSASTGAEVVYSLPLFHELDFYVNEGFRRIAHGGVETGGILFGSYWEGKVRLEAYRPIVSEHAFGPSFVLSDNDLDRLQKQLHESTSDAELQELSAVGWFIGHTRRDLVLSERETEWFMRFFPEPGQVTVLIKPERFQPTRFGFVMRTNGELAVDLRQEAIILPLSGRAGETGGEKGRVEVTPARSIPAESLVTDAAKPAQLPLVASAPPTTIQQVPVAAVPSLVAPVRSVSELPPLPPRSQTQGRSIWTVAGWLVLCAAIAATAYWMYLQLFPTAIPLTVSGRPPVVTLEWPAYITTGVANASLRIGNQPPEPLSTEQKQFGTARITAPASDTRIELVVHHWYREERGVLRLLSKPEIVAKPVYSTHPAEASQQP